MTSLRPNECVQRAVISTRSRLVGEYISSDNPDLFITHAHRQGSEISKSRFETSYSQNLLVATFRTEPAKESVLVPNYSFYGDLLSTLLSILYGKCFYFHGFQESNGLFMIPKSIDLGPTSLIRLPPFNHRPRKCVPTPLNLSEIVRIDSILREPLRGEASRTLFSAGRFYNRALAQMEEQPELAYLDLITCGEIIADSLEIPQDRLDDEQLANMLRRISSEMEDGQSVARWVSSPW